jgi:hypothetical protein
VYKPPPPKKKKTYFGAPKIGYGAICARTMLNKLAIPGALFEVAVGFAFIFNPAALHNGYEPKDGFESYAFEVSGAKSRIINL